MRVPFQGVTSDVSNKPKEIPVRTGFPNQIKCNRLVSIQNRQSQMTFRTGLWKKDVMKEWLDGLSS